MLHMAKRGPRILPRGLRTAHPFRALPARTMPPLVRPAYEELLKYVAKTFSCCLHACLTFFQSFRNERF